MAEIVLPRKACAVNPLKSSTPLGAALAFLGIEGAVPLFHGSQGCTSFALVLAVRHFREAIPLQTTAMNEASTVLGGADHLEEALVTVATRMNPAFIGVASTALVETRGEDLAGELRAIRRRPELARTAIVYASTPDFEGALEDGWARATAAVIAELAEPGEPPGAARAAEPRQINVLPGVHQTPADLDELREIIEAFGLGATILPDTSRSLDGHVPDRYIGTSLGGTTLAQIRGLGRALHTIAIGEHMRAPAEALAARTGVPATVFGSLSGLAGSDALVALLSALSGRDAPPRVRRQRSQLVDALLDGHFWFAGKRVAIASDPDLLCSLAALLRGLGAEIVAAVTTAKGPAALAQVACDRVVVGDLADLEDLAGAAGAQLLITHSHGRMAAERLGLPLFRVGFPIFDRLGVQHRCSIGYRGTRQLVYDLANTFIAAAHEPVPPPTEDTRHGHA